VILTLTIDDGNVEEDVPRRDDDDDDEDEDDEDEEDDDDEDDDDEDDDGGNDDDECRRDLGGVTVRFSGVDGEDGTGVQDFGSLPGLLGSLPVFFFFASCASAKFVLLAFRLLLGRPVLFVSVTI
jgi:hypothetical protein